MSGDNDKITDPNARLLNYRLESDLTANKKIQNADINNVIKEQSFLTAIANARKKLGLDTYFPDTADEDDIDDWLDGKVKEQLSASEQQSKDVLQICWRIIDEAVLSAIKEANLQYLWYQFVRAYIALGKKPKTIKPKKKLKIYAESFSENLDSVQLRLEKGLTAEDYRKAWTRIKRYLNQPNTTAVRAENTKNMIFLDRQNGMTYGQLAEKYFPNEYAKDQLEKTDYARDKVKKIVSRFKRPA
jgi:hypothetical protein